MSDIVKALASMLSAGADANSRVASAGLAANASLGSSANALKGDMYRANVQSQLGRQGINADMQRSAGEQALRAMLGQAQLRMEGQRNNLASQQLGFDRQRLASDRDLKLAELGLGPFAPKVPDMSDLAGGGQPAAADPQPQQEYGLLDRLLGRRPVPGAAPNAGANAGQRFDPAQEMIKRMFLANPNNPRVQSMMSELLGVQQRQSQWQQEFDFKKNAPSDPNVLLQSLAPSIAGMKDVTPDSLPGILANLKASLGGSSTATSNLHPDIATAARTNSSTATAATLSALGISDDLTPWQTGEAIGSRASSLTAQDLAAIQSIIAAKVKMNPNYFNDQAAAHPGVMLLRKLLTTPSPSLSGDALQQEFEAQRREYYKDKNDPKDFTFFGIPKLW